MPQQRAAGESSPARFPRAHLRIVHYVAKCQQCPFEVMNPREAHVHSLVESHTVNVAKHYVLEPPE